MKQYWINVQQELLGVIEKNEETISDYKMAIAELEKSNSEYRKAVEDLKKLE